MKRLINLLFIISAAMAVLACDETKKGHEEEPEGEFYEFPLNTQEDGFEAGDNGVTVNVSALKEKNIIFNLVPGKAVKSYRVEVYPKAMIYNLLLNEGCVEAETAVCEDKIIQLVSNSSSAGSYVFNETTDDFAAKEFDWANSIYSTAEVLPDCDYFIMVVGYYDAEGTNPASLSIATVTTPSLELRGDPQMAIEAEVGYRAFIVRYHPNEDCKYFYHWIWSTDEMSEYIDLFGDRLMRDFCRAAASSASDASLAENLVVKRTFDLSNQINRDNTAIAVAVDINGTPAKEIMRQDFSLMEIPEGDFTPKAVIRPASRIGATLAYLEVEMEKSCMSCFYRVYPSDQAEIWKKATADEKASEAISIASEGWGVANPRFSFNSDLGTLTGDAFKTSDERQVELQPDTEYVVLYVAKNNFAELSELCFSEPFKTKTLVRDNPSACIGDVHLELTDASRWGFKYNFSYDYETTACYRFQLVWPYDPESEIIPPHYIDDKDDHAKWMTFFFDTFQESPALGMVPVTNMWEAEKSNFESLHMYGYESGIEYVIAYCAEDINGVVGPVKFASVTTTAPNPGPNPVVTLDDIRYDEENGQVAGHFTANADTKMIKYFCVTSSDATLFSSCALNDLVNASRRTYEAYLALWESQLMQLGLSTSAEAVSFAVDTEKISDVPVLVAAVAIGEEDGQDVYSPVACKIYHKGEFKDLSDYRTPKN